MLSRLTKSTRLSAVPLRTILWYFSAPVAATTIALVLGAIIIAALGANPLAAYEALLVGALGTKYGLALTIVRTAPLVFAGLAVAVPRRSGLFNIGAEGQLQLGGLVAAAAALTHQNFAVGLLGAIVAGALWAGLAGYLRAWHGVNEVISTIMLNSVAIGIVLLAVQGPLGKQGATYPTTGALPADSLLPFVIPDMRIHAGVALAGLALLISWWLLFRTTIGYRMRAVGLNPVAAHHAGISVPSVMFMSMLVGGAWAGLAGACEVLGVQNQLAQDWSSGWGYTGIVVAFLGGSHPGGIALVALFYGVINAGASNMQFTTGVPGAIVPVIQGLPVLFLVLFVSWRSLPSTRRRRLAV